MCMHLILLVAVATCMPNSKQLIFPHQRTEAGSGELQLSISTRLGMTQGIIAGILLVGFLYTKYSAAPSPFIYYNF